MSGKKCWQGSTQGIDLLEGEATFISSHEVLIAGKPVSAAHIIIATGSETIVPPRAGLKEAGFITNVQAVSLPTLPRRLAIVGGGAIGLEFAQMFRRFGVDVTVIERSPTSLDKEVRIGSSLEGAILAIALASIKKGIHLKNNKFY